MSIAPDRFNPTVIRDGRAFTTLRGTDIEVPVAHIHEMWPDDNDYMVFVKKCYRDDPSMVPEPVTCVRAEEVPEALNGLIRQTRENGAYDLYDWVKRRHDVIECGPLPLYILESNLGCEDDSLLNSGDRKKSYWMTPVEKTILKMAQFEAARGWENRLAETLRLKTPTNSRDGHARPCWPAVQLIKYLISKFQITDKEGKIGKIGDHIIGFQICAKDLSKQSGLHVSESTLRRYIDLLVRAGYINKTITNRVYLESDKEWKSVTYYNLRPENLMPVLNPAAYRKALELSAKHGMDGTLFFRLNRETVKRFRKGGSRKERFTYFSWKALTRLSFNELFYDREYLFGRFSKMMRQNNRQVLSTNVSSRIREVNFPEITPKPLEGHSLSFEKILDVRPSEKLVTPEVPLKARHLKKLKSRQKYASLDCPGYVYDIEKKQKVRTYLLPPGKALDMERAIREMKKNNALKFSIGVVEQTQEIFDNILTQKTQFNVIADLSEQEPGENLDTMEKLVEADIMPAVTHDHKESDTLRRFTVPAMSEGICGLNGNTAEAEFIDSPIPDREFGENVMVEFKNITRDISRTSAAYFFSYDTPSVADPLYSSVEGDMVDFYKKVIKTYKSAPVKTQVPVRTVPESRDNCYWKCSSGFYRKFRTRSVRPKDDLNFQFHFWHWRPYMMSIPRFRQAAVIVMNHLDDFNRVQFIFGNGPATRSPDFALKFAKTILRKGLNIHDLTDFYHWSRVNRCNLATLEYFANLWVTMRPSKWVKTMREEYACGSTLIDDRILAKHKFLRCRDTFFREIPTQFRTLCWDPNLTPEQKKFYWTSEQIEFAETVSTALPKYAALFDNPTMSYRKALENIHTFIRTRYRKVMGGLREYSHHEDLVDRVQESVIRLFGLRGYRNFNPDDINWDVA